MEESPVRVTVLLFAAIREAAGVDEFALDLSAGSTVADVWPRLVERCPRIGPLRAAVAWAVNHAYVPDDQTLRDGDLVAVLPPVSGGSGGDG